MHRLRRMRDGRGRLGRCLLYDHSGYCAPRVHRGHQPIFSMHMVSVLVGRKQPAFLAPHHSIGPVPDEPIRNGRLWR